MSLKPFANTDEFLTKFDLNTPPPYENVTHFTDCRVGYSVMGCFPSNLRFIPARTLDGRDDTVAIIHVTYTHPDESSQPVDLRRVPIVVRINRWSLYLRGLGRPGFDPSDPRSPTEESLRASRASVAPIGFDSEGKYFFDHSADNFMDSKGNPLSGRDVLDQVFQRFCDSTHLFRGLRIQFLHKTRGALVSLVRSMESRIEWTLRTIFGRTITHADPLRGTEEHLERMPETAKFGGIEVQSNVLIASAVLVIIFLGVQEYLETSDDYLSRLLTNRLFIPPATLVGIWFLDRVCPRLLLSMKKALREVRYRLLSLKFRV